MDQSRYAPSQWETLLQCNDVSHWLGAYLDWSLLSEKLTLLVLKSEYSRTARSILQDWKTHWGRVTHICVSKLTIIGSDNGLLPRRRQATIWTNAGVLLIEPFGTKFSEISIEVVRVSFKKMPLKGSSVKWRPFCLGLNELNVKSLASFPKHRKSQSYIYNIC